MSQDTYLLIERGPEGTMTVATAYSTKADAERGVYGRDPKVYSVVEVADGKPTGEFGSETGGPLPTPEDPEAHWEQVTRTVSDYVTGLIHGW